jgi:hypothetical protein
VRQDDRVALAAKPVDAFRKGGVGDRRLSGSDGEHAGLS